MSERFQPFPQGVLHLYGENAINTSASLEDAANTAAKYNTAERLTHIVDKQHLLYRQSVLDDEKVSFVVPSAPYTPFSMMLVAHNEPLQTEHSQSIYGDYSPELQREWWRSVVSGLRALDEATGGSDRTHHNIYVENCVPVTNHQYRTSRTLVLPHGQFISINESAVEHDPSPIDHMKAEQAFLADSDFVKKCITGLESGLTNLKGGLELAEISPHATEPYGYRMRVRNHDFEGLADFMRKHHSAYTAASREYFTFSSDPDIRDYVTPQPSYRLYLYTDKKHPDHITILISPEVFSHGGVLEAIGIRLVRGTDQPKHMSEEELGVLRKSFIEGVKSTEAQKLSA